MKWVRIGVLIFVGTALWLAPKIDWQIFFRETRDRCVFCDRGVLEQNTFYQGVAASAILTHKPAFDGHVLVIPTRHVERFEDLTDAEMLEIKEIIRKVDLVSQKIYGSTGYLILEKNGREAGQSVPHVHFHYMPRNSNHGPLFSALQILIAPLLKPLSSAEMREQISLYSDL